ncbi:GGDEF domain-containing protein [Secundilactobacillus mixtipabuli]|uniref:Diguanylate cyclase n=1 Tax=Secundilactobacillus mixtipabuli TaxID=1435342 RepID=A0A1Z5IC38_9LACO|nr:GGDEF domain-containing protein [Secundilactobacillus mixtipabuli]GAW99198.1 diguanylate cyclase [Secundilactobacillus mixtipabuli]
MGPIDIWASFILSLITNIIVLCGSISFLFWLEELSGPWITRFRASLETILCTLFFAYLWGQSWLNSTLSPNAFGLHWSFLNVIIVSAFLINVYLKIWQEVLIEVGLTLFYILLYAPQIGDGTAILGFALILVLLVSYFGGERLFRHPITMYLGLDLLAAVSLGLIASVYGAPTDPYFWIRQLSALIILSVTGIEYTLASNRILEQNRRNIALSKLDGLTQLNNFTQFSEDLVTAHKRFQTAQEPYAVFEFDIDLFKRVNDNYGHLVGNTVLKAVAQELAHFAASTSFQTTAYRIGGEEFCLIVQADCLNRDFAGQLANQVRHKINRLDFEVNGLLFNITVSVGQANSREYQYDAHDIYKSADRSLYLSKQRGRDRVTLEGFTIRSK